jgi:hypothetical protein
LEFAVWQFVRIMVRLEEHAAKKRGFARTSVFGAWRKRWQELDRRLSKLGQTDGEAFADLMLRQKVVIDDSTVAQRAEVARVVTEVIEQLKAEIKNSAGDESRESDLRFEKKELEGLRSRLKRRAR